MKLGRFLVLAYLVLMPWSGLAFGNLSGHDYARIAQLLLMLACAACLLVARPATLALPASTAGRWVAGLMVVQTLVSVSMAAEPAWAAREVALALGLVGIAVTMASASSLRELRHDVVAVVLAGAFYGALVLCVAALSLANRQPMLWREFSLGYSHPRFLNHVQTVVLPLLVVAAGCAPRRSLLRAGAWFGLIAGFALLWFTGGRATLIGVVVGALACLVLLRRRAKATVQRLAIGMAGGFALYLALFIAMPALLGMTVPFELANRAQDSNSVFSRLILWRMSIAQVAHSPLWGEGPMHFAHHQNIDAAHPHNIYLQVAGEWGLPMLILVLTSAWMGLRLLTFEIRQREGDGDPVSIGTGLLLTSVAVACDGVLSGNFVMPVSQVWIAAALGWGMAWVRLDAPHKHAPRSNPNASGKWLGAGLLAGQLALGIAVFPEITNIPSYIEQRSTLFPSATTNPRFWSHGWF